MTSDGGIADADGDERRSSSVGAGGMEREARVSVTANLPEASLVNNVVFIGPHSGRPVAAIFGVRRDDGNGEKTAGKPVQRGLTGDHPKGLLPSAQTGQSPLAGRSKMILPKMNVALIAAAATFAVAPQLARADAVADFYKGKQISVYIGFTAGGGYDVYARLVAQHMGNHIPGNPMLIPKNMAGAGSRKVTAYIYAVAPKDGTSLATADQSQALQQAMEDPTIQFDVRKLIWIGNPNKDVNTTAVWYTSGIKSLEDAKTHEVILGATGSNTSAQYPQAMNYFAGTKFKIINGYPGGNDINLAMERGEVMGRGSNAWASWKGTKPDWLRDKKIVILAQIGLQKAPDLPDVPLMMDLGKTPEDRAALKLLSAATEIGRPIYSTPSVPADRVAALRKAFDDTMKDPKFRDDAAQAKLDLDPVSGARLQEVVNEMLATPKAVVSRLAEALVEDRDVLKNLQPAGGGNQ